MLAADLSEFYAAALVLGWGASIVLLAVAVWRDWSHTTPADGCVCHDPARRCTCRAHTEDVT